MTDRLNSLDASFLAAEDALTPLHVGSVLVFEPPSDGFDHERLVALISERISLVPRYRQRVRTVPGGLANPVWVDDDRFDVTYHVRRSALPKPGSDEQLEELVARILPRPLDRSRPLWEVYLVEGLRHGRFAIITKTHHALVDGINAVDIAQLLVDESAVVMDGPGATPWEPRRPPSNLDLLVGAVTDTVCAPGNLLEAARAGISDVTATVARVAQATTTVVAALARVSSAAPDSPLNAPVGRARRFVMIGTDLADHKLVRTALASAGEEVSTHDVILAVLTGAFRSWLLTRGESVTPGTTVRALVPVSVTGETDVEPGAELWACYVDLPVGEPSAAMRVHQIAYAMRGQLESGRAVPADILAGLGGFAPATIHALGARLGTALGRRLKNVVITNVPGPQQPLHAGGARLVSTFPVMPLQPGQALAIGLTSYDGAVYYGLFADREALPDLDVLGRGIVDSLAELVEVDRPRAARSRSRGKAGS